MVQLYSLFVSNTHVETVWTTLLLILGKTEWMLLSTCSVNSIMVETLKMSDVFEIHYRGGNGLRAQSVVCSVKPMLSEELMYVKDLIICLSCEQDDVQSRTACY